MTRRILVAVAVLVFAGGLALAIVLPHGFLVPAGLTGYQPLGDFAGLQRLLLVRTAAALSGAIVAGGLLAIASRTGRT